jgi:hypothetical protein
MLADSCGFKPSLSKTTTDIIYLTPIQLFSNFLIISLGSESIGTMFPERKYSPSNNRKVVP